MEQIAFDLKCEPDILAGGSLDNADPDDSPQERTMEKEQQEQQATCQATDRSPSAWFYSCFLFVVFSHPWLTFTASI